MFGKLWTELATKGCPGVDPALIGVKSALLQMQIMLRLCSKYSIAVWPKNLLKHPPTNSYNCKPFRRPQNTNNGIISCLHFSVCAKVNGWSCVPHSNKIETTLLILNQLSVLPFMAQTRLSHGCYKMQFDFIGVCCISTPEGRIF